MLGGWTYTGTLEDWVNPLASIDIPIPMATINDVIQNRGGNMSLILRDSYGIDTPEFGGWAFDSKEMADSSGPTLFYEIAAALIPGDANNDQMVDVSDLGILAGNWDTPTGMVWGDGDFSGDGAVDVSDLGILAGNWGFGTGVPEPPEPTPEPTTVMVLLVAGALGLLRRRR